jgi:predicted RNA binding protein YcfA (HicA-like mRNA interferase family)
MTRRPRDVSGVELVKRLARVGFMHTRTEGSHAVCIAREQGKLGVYVPLHRNVAIGTMHNILRRVASYLEVSMGELLELLDL